MATPMDFSGLLNPKRVIQRREDESDDEFKKRKAEAEKAAVEAAMATTALQEGPRFGKSFTPAEKADQKAKLEALLKKRQ